MEARGTLTGTAADVGPGRTPARTRVPWGPRVVAWLLLAGSGGLLVSMLVVGERTTSYADLRDAVRAGDVHEVTVAGEGPAVPRGVRTVEVHWRDGLLRHVARVAEASPRAARHRDQWDPGVPLIRTRVTDDLARLDPRLDVRQERLDLSSDSDVLGWRLPGWAGMVAFLVWLGSLVLVALGPKPWRANRWGWFWLVLIASPWGMVALLVLGGASGLFPPAEPGRRMRGGWGFLLAVAVAMASSATVTALGL